MSSFSSSDSILNINNSTIVGTVSEFNERQPGPVDSNGPGMFNITSSIITSLFSPINSTNSGGNNLISRSDSFVPAQGDLVGTSNNPLDPLLGELQDNGGATPTIALLDGSIAIDAGSNPNGFGTDQRGEGFSRTIGNGTDIGAFEVQANNGGLVIPDQLVVSTLNDESDGDFSAGDLSLREAILFSDAGDTITFDSSLSGGTINLVIGELRIQNDLTIEGLGANQITIDASNDSRRVFSIDDGNEDVMANVNIRGLTITGGTGNGVDSPIDFLDFSTSIGGGILNREKLNLDRSTITDNVAFGFGGGIFNSGEITITNSTVAANQASSFSNNEQGDGGGVFNSGTAIITNSTISNNGGNSAGGILNASSDSGNAELIIANSTITNNSTSAGAAINNQSGTVTIVSSIIANNETDILGNINSQGNNLIGNGNNVNGLVDSDLVNIDPQLGELQDNGGTTQTVALLDGSPAIDAGSNPNGLGTDQRREGFSRTIGNGTDIGAFEL